MYMVKENEKKFKVLATNDLNTANKELNQQKKRHWFMDLTRMVGWILLMIISVMFFFQVLPVLLLALGHILMLFGSTEQAPSIIDALVYLPTAISFSGLLTYGLYRLLRKQYANAMRIQNQLSVRFSIRYAERKGKKSN